MAGEVTTVVALVCASSADPIAHPWLLFQCTICSQLWRPSIWFLGWAAWRWASHLNPRGAVCCRAHAANQTRRWRLLTPGLTLTAGHTQPWEARAATERSRRNSILQVCARHRFPTSHTCRIRESVAHAHTYNPRSPPCFRFADGRAVLRSSVREFLASVAMEALDIPTTKALSLVTSGESVVRDQFYNGQPKVVLHPPSLTPWPCLSSFQLVCGGRVQREPGAVVCRVAPSFLRFGSLELQVSHQRLDQLKGLVDYLIAHHFPHLHHIVPDADRYVALHVWHSK